MQALSKKKLTRRIPVHSMMIVSGISMTQKSMEDNSLGGTLTDKINVENFCYNYMDYTLHKTIQLSESDTKTYLLKLFNYTEPEALPAPALKPSKSLKSDKSSKGEKGGRSEKSGKSPKPVKRGLTKDLGEDPPTPKTPPLPPHYYPQIKQTIQTKVELRLRRFFNRKSKDNCVLFLSGHGHKATGSLILNAMVDAQLSLENIFNAWDDHPWDAPLRDIPGRTPRINHLLIIIDACYSGKWVRKMEDVIKRTDVSIQTSCSGQQKSYDNLKKGATFLNNFLFLNGLKDLKYMNSYNEEVSGVGRIRQQTPSFYSKSNDLEWMYGLRVRLSSWEQFEWRNTTNLVGVFESENGLDRISGEFKSLQLDGYGEKRLACGRVETGTFVSDKLNGKGSMTWRDLEVHGEFQEGQPVGLSKLKASLGSIKPREYTQLPHRFKVNFKDDNVSQVITTGLGNMKWTKSYYVDGLVTESVKEFGIKNGFGFYWRNDQLPCVAWWANGRIEVQSQLLPHGNCEVTEELGEEGQQLAVAERVFRNKCFLNNRQMDVGISGQGFTAAYEPFAGDEFEALNLARFSWKRAQVEDQKLIGPGNSWTYTGSVQNGQPHGKGTLVISDSATIEGDWVEGKLHGMAKYRTKHQRGEGEFERGMRSGLGQTAFPNGDYHIGEYRLNKLMGRGDFRFSYGGWFQGTLYLDNQGKLWGLGLLGIPRNQVAQFFKTSAEEAERPKKEPPELPPLKYDDSIDTFLKFGKSEKKSTLEQYILFEGQLLRGLLNGFGRMIVGTQKLQGIFYNNRLKTYLTVNPAPGVSYSGGTLSFPDVGVPLEMSDAGIPVMHGKGKLVMPAVQRPGLTPPPHLLVETVMDGIFHFSNLVQGTFDTNLGRGRISGKFEGGNNYFTGQMWTPDGLMYEGNFRGFYPQGPGILTMPSGNQYRVDMERGYIKRNISGLLLWDMVMASGKALCSFKEVGNQLLLTMEYLNGDVSLECLNGDKISGFVLKNVLRQFTYTSKMGLELSSPPEDRSIPKTFELPLDPTPAVDPEGNPVFNIGNRSSEAQPQAYGQVNWAGEGSVSHRKQLWHERVFPMDENLTIRYSSGLMLETHGKNQIGDIEGTITFPDGSKVTGDFFSVPQTGDGVTAVDHWVFSSKERDPEKRIVTIKETSLRKHGLGVEEDSDGLVFRGSFICNKRWGFGQLTLQNQAPVTHFFMNGLVEKGFKKTLENGREVEEMWTATPRVEVDPDDQKFIGYEKVSRLDWGRIWWPDGRFYEGQTRDGQPHGFGKMSGLEEGLFRGRFNNGLRQGDGILVGKTTIIEGSWNQDQLECTLSQAETTCFEDPQSVVFFSWVSKM